MAGQFSIAVSTMSPLVSVLAATTKSDGIYCFFFSTPCFFVYVWCVAKL